MKKLMSFISKFFLSFENDARSDKCLALIFHNDNYLDFNSIDADTLKKIRDSFFDIPTKCVFYTPPTAEFESARYSHVGDSESILAYNIICKRIFELENAKT